MASQIWFLQFEVLLKSNLSAFYGGLNSVFVKLRAVASRFCCVLQEVFCGLVLRFCGVFSGEFHRLQDDDFAFKPHAKLLPHAPFCLVDQPECFVKNAAAAVD